MSYFYGESLDFSKPDPIIKWETRCPICKQKIFFIDNSRTPNYWQDMAEERLRQLKKANELFLKIDEWAMEHIGDTYLQSKLKKIYEKYNFKTDNTNAKGKE